jgi:aspartyl-tRNA(Asn)/glutamyl-tRNA(Gln) amidotransferase subunit A
MERPAALSATELICAYAARALSPIDVVRDVAEIVAAREPTLHAFYVHDLDDVHEQAAASERRYRDGLPLGPLDGVPVTVKENLGRAGIPMPLGNAGVTPLVPQRSSPVVERLEEAGAVVLGSTVMPDWGMLSSGVSSLHGITRSPWDESLTTGGSSSGAGAAAAAGYGPLHVGTDIGGSIRLPGTWLGLTTLKPSAGRVPLDAPYLGRAAGPITRSAADAALLLSVLSRPDARDWTSLPAEVLPATTQVLDPARLRVGLHLEAGCGRTVEPEVRAAVADAAAVFADAGATLGPVEPFMRQAWLEDLDQFWRVRSLIDLDSLDRSGRERVLPFIRRWAEGGRRLEGVEVLRAYASIMAIQQATVAATAAFDIVLSPVAPMAAFPAEWPMPWGEGDEAMSHIGFTAPYNLSGQPAGTTNCGFTPDGRTIGVQVSGRRFDDVGVLAALAWFEAHRPAVMTPRWPIRS